jgi:hypothetical protein
MQMVMMVLRLSSLSEIVLPHFDEVDGHGPLVVEDQLIGSGFG